MDAQASILIADDDEISARYLKRLLTREGHSVSVVTTAADAMHLCRTRPPDIVVLDLLTPDGRGFDLCRQLKREPQTRFVPVVIVTSHVMDVDMRTRVAARARAILQKKDLSIESLATALASIHRRAHP